jgi:hypothetical protein
MSADDGMEIELAVLDSKVLQLCSDIPEKFAPEGSFHLELKSAADAKVCIGTDSCMD